VRFVEEDGEKSGCVDDHGSPPEVVVGGEPASTASRTAVSQTDPGSKVGSLGAHVGSLVPLVNSCPDRRRLGRNAAGTHEAAEILLEAVGDVEVDLRHGVRPPLLYQIQK
jgi:hypothetical protein